ncbi:MAG: PTS sugar transporter subunit IIA [Phycisphaeraceae bacterium]|nr:PTS sugar transporter subunit IIA [Phycisphaeraceae bacterium]
MKLSDFVVNDAIIVNLATTEKQEAIEQMIDKLIAAKAADKKLRSELVKSIMEREKHGSTGFGKGVAVPHVKHEKIKKMAAGIAISSAGVEFAALDKKPVHSIVLLLSPKDKPDEHLQAMENIFTNLQQDTFRRFLRQAATVEEVIELLHDADAQQLAG